MMNRLLGLLVGAVAGIAWGSACPVVAQSINIDYSDKGGIAPAGFAAAGLAGHWNLLVDSNTDNGAATPLVDLNGAVTTATLTHTNLGFFVSPGARVPQSPHTLLLGDYAGSFGPPLILEFDGLQPGNYEVLTYMATRQDFPATQLVTINDDSSTVRSTIGRWSGTYVEGETHTRHVASVDNGSLRIAISEGNDPIANGLQLRMLVPEPSTLLLAAAGAFVGAVRRR